MASSKKGMYQESKPNSWDGPPDKLSLIPHAYEKDRVGAPPLLLLPLRSSNIAKDNDVYQRYQDQTLQNKIDSVLAKYEIEVEERSLVLRTQAIHYKDSAMTLYIRTPKGLEFHADRQRNCVVELYDLLNDSTGSQDIITVELVGHRLWAPKTLWYVEPGHPFLRAWNERILKRFIDILASPSAPHICSMDLLRLGFNLEDNSKNPITVSLTVEYGHDPPDWEPTGELMVKELRDAGFEEVEVDFERGEIWGGWDFY